jgi:Icc protein
VATDEVRVVIGERTGLERLPREQDKALNAWPDHELLGTQRGLNENGKKWGCRQR